jgi:hypothetical protein
LVRGSIGPALLSQHSRPEAELGARHERTEHRGGLALVQFLDGAQAGLRVPDKLDSFGALGHGPLVFDLHALDLLSQRQLGLGHLLAARLLGALGEIASH